MSTNYTRLYYHLVWATKSRAPAITADVETLLFSYIRSKCESFRTKVYALNGMPDHIHLACTIPTDLSISRFLGNIKGGSAHLLNHTPTLPAQFSWQRGYGALTLNRSDLPRIITYIEQQKEHHRAGNLLKALETWDEPPATDSTPIRAPVGIRETEPSYGVDGWGEP